MTSIRQRRESLKKAREILKDTIEVRARRRAEAERARDLAIKEEARRAVARMLERERAIDAINKKLDELEEVANWLLYGRSRGSR